MSKYQYDKSNLKYGHSTAINDTDVIVYIKNFKPDIFESLQTDSSRYIDIFKNWLLKSNNNSLLGLENFKYGVYSNGTTESFEKFYWNNQNRRFRCFKGEYLYHKIAWRDRDWAFIEDKKLDKNDAVVISLPFADTGCKHEKMDYVLHNCSAMGIPVLVDGCYFGISKGIEYNLNHTCITDVTFSLSKVFPVAHARIGIRFTKKDTDDLLFVTHKHSYNNRIGAQLGIYLMEKFSADYIYNKYRPCQLNICKKLNVSPSDTVIFGIGDHSWQEYNRGTETNRLSFHKILNEN